MARSRDEGMERRIIDAAIAVFGEQGFQATTLKDIASVAGISTGSVYTYFADKDALFRAAVEFGWNRFLTELEGLTKAGMQRKQRVAALLDRGFQTLDLSLPLLRGMLFDSSRQSLLAPSIERVINAIDILLLPDTLEGAPEGRKIADTGVRHRLIRIMVNGILFTAAFGSLKPVPETMNDLKATITVFLAHFDTVVPLSGILTPQEIPEPENGQASREGNEL